MTNLYQIYFITTYILYFKLVKKALQNIFSLWTHCCLIIKLCIPCYNNITWYLLLIFFLILQILKFKFLFLYNSYRIEVHNKCYKITFLPPYLSTLSITSCRFQNLAHGHFLSILEKYIYFSKRIDVFQKHLAYFLVYPFLSIYISTMCHSSLKSQMVR